MKQPHLKFASASHYETYSQVEKRIAMEAEFLATLSKTVREVIPSLMTMAKEFIGSTKLVDLSSLFKTGNDSRPVFLSLINQHKHIHTSNLAVIVPEGFIGNFADYSKSLEKSAEHVTNVISGVLNPYNQFLSTLLSSKTARTSSFGHLGFLAKLDVDRENLNKEIAKYFRISSTATKSTVGKVIRSNTEWETVLVSLPRIVAKLNEVERKAIQNSVNDCVDLINSIQKAADTGELDNLSGPMLKQLSQATLSVAREVEFYSITAYRAATLDKCITDTTEHITKSLND